MLHINCYCIMGICQSRYLFQISAQPLQEHSLTSYPGLQEVVQDTSASAMRHRANCSTEKRQIGPCS